MCKLALSLNRPLHSQSGLTLLEIMVTVVILSLGLLGLAGLQMTGLKNNRNAYYQTVAAQLAQDLAERIKADQAGATGTTYNSIDSKHCTNNTVCDRAAILAAALPSGQALVTSRAGTPKSFFVAIRWTDIQLPTGTHGWSDTDASAVAACDTPTNEPKDNVNCYYTMSMP